MPSYIQIINYIFFTCIGGGFLGGLEVLPLFLLGTGRGVEDGAGCRREGESDKIMEERRVVLIGVRASVGGGLPSKLFP